MKKRTMRWTKLFALVVAVVMCVTVFPVTGGKASAATTASSQVASEQANLKEASVKASNYISVSGPNADGWVTLKGVKLNTSYTYSHISIDGGFPIDYTYRSSMNLGIDMKPYGVGTHTISVGIYKNKASLIQTEEVTTNLVGIYSSPANNLTQYESYSTYFFYRTGSKYYYDSSCVQYIDYRRAGDKTWKTQAMRGAGGTQYTLKGLKPKSSYQARVYFVKETADHRYIIAKGPYSNTVTFRSGVAKTPVKSFTLKAYRIRKKKYVKGYRTRYRFYRYGYVWRTTPVYGYYYQYKLKAIVKMKRKPGAAGINICGKWVKGNKKKYTKKLGTFTSTVKPRKRHMKVSVYSYQNRTYGGYSPLWKKNRKVK